MTVHERAIALRDALPDEQRQAWNRLVRFGERNVPGRGKQNQEMVAAARVRTAQEAGDRWWEWDFEKEDAA